MATWTPPTDAVETSSGWTPPTDAVEVSTPQQVAPQVTPTPVQQPVRVTPGYKPTLAEEATGAVVEPIMKMGSSLIAKPVSEVAGIAAMFSDYLGKKDGDPKGFQKYVQESLTYQPRTVAGASKYNPLNAIPEAIGSATNAVTAPVMGALRGDSAADSARGMAVNALGEAVPQALGFVGVKNAPLIIKRTGEAVGGVASDVAKSSKFVKKTAIEAASTSDWQRAAAIDAAKLARKNDIVMNPALVNPTAPNKLRMAATGGSDVFDTAASINNKNRWNNMVREELGLSKSTPLNETTYKAQLTKAAAPYEKAAELGQLAPVTDVIDAIRKIEVPEILIPGEQSAGKVARTSDQIINQIENGMTGAEALKTVKDLYREAKITRQAMNNGKDVGSVAIDAMRAKTALAKEMEKLLEANITDPAWKKAFGESRKKMSQIYTLRDATNLATNQIDPKVLARELEGPNFLTGAAKEMGQIAANFPEIADIYAKSGMTLRMPSRSGPAGTAGYAAGTAVGGAVPVSAVSAAVSSLGGKLYARKLMKGEAQAKLATPVDRRIFPTETPQPGSQRGLVPYVSPTEVVDGVPNFTFGKPDQPAPKVTAVGEDLSTPRIGMSREPVGGQMGALRAEDARVLAAQRKAAAAQDAAEAAKQSASRQPTGRGVQFDLDPVTGKLVPTSQGVKGATPEIWQANTGANLKSASEKAAMGRGFDMTAAEKVAWNKTSVDLKAVSPEFSKLTDKQILAKMQDREWVQDALNKAQQKAAMYDVLERQSQDRLAQSLARINREKLLDVVEQLQDTLGSRPSSRGYGQGPKTRAFQRGLLTGAE